uniref:acyl-CoA synthetase n=1 Tax=Effusibacillus pohliae TaxID=232270 RepID=UPI00036A20A8
RASDWLASRARLTPGKLAVVEASSGLRLTYEQLQRRVSALAGCLRQLGVGKGDRIALLANNSVKHFDLLFAAGKIGAVFVPLNYRFAVPELAYVLTDCTPVLLVYEEPYAAAAAELVRQAAVQHVWGERQYQAALADELGKRAGQGAFDGTVRDTHADMEDPWAIIYTGGTTGTPKGAILSHRAITWNAINTVISWGITEQDVTPVYLPMFHTGGLNALATPVLYAGGTVVIGREFDPPAVIRVLEQENCTIALFVPTMYHMLIQTPEFAKASFASMHTFLSGGAPCPHPIYRAFWAKGLRFKEGYGLTEAGPNNFCIDPQDAIRKIGSVGKPMFHNWIRLVDEHGRDVVDGQEGEVWIAGPHVFSGYWNQPEVTARTFCDGWLRTGDVGRRDKDGFYYIVGRKKDMIITGGENVYPLEVEHVLQSHPAVSEAAVVGLPDEKWGEAVTAVVVLTPGSHVTVEELKAYCSGKLAGYKIPKRFLFAGELPKTAVGKIDKKQLVSLYTEQKAGGSQPA